MRAKQLAANECLVTHGSWSKHTLFEIDTCVPLIVRAPGYEGGQRTYALVEAVDIYQTLAELASLPAPMQSQGLSFVPLLEEPGRSWKEAAFSQYLRSTALEGEGVMGRAIRTDRYRYIEWRDTPTGELLARELYNHRTDPEENVNVAGDPDYAGVVERLSRKLKAGWRAALPEGMEVSSVTERERDHDGCAPGDFQRRKLRGQRPRWRRQAEHVRVAARTTD